MRRFINIYITVALGLSYYLTKEQLFPATVAIRQIMNEKEDFRVIYVNMITFGFFLVLLGIGLGVYYVLKPKKESNELIDEPNPETTTYNNTTPTHEKEH